MKTSRSAGRSKLELTRRVFFAAAVGLSCAALPNASLAQNDWPSKPIELIVPFAPGGGTDLLGRALAEALTDGLDVPVQVVNRSGGGGVVGFEALRTAEPDGYTIGILTAQIITANLRGVMEATYHDFQPVAMVNIDYPGFAVLADSQFDTLQDLIDYARENPGKLTMGNGGEGGSFHMSAKNLETQAGVTFKHVPFEGGPAAILQLLGGHIDATVNGTTDMLPYVESGEFRVLAVAGDTRFSGYPDVPSSEELGFPLRIGTWRAIGVPKDTPDEIVAKLNDAIAEAVKAESFTEHMASMNSSIRYFGPDELLDYLEEQEEVYRKIVD